MSPTPDLPVDDARERIARLVRPVCTAETIGLRQSLGRILAADVVSPLDLPAEDRSAMDGYALRWRDLRSSPRLPVLASRLAGDASVLHVPPGHCVRIMTGASIPPGLDTVVAQEAASTHAGSHEVQFEAQRSVIGSHVRRRGEEMRAGEVVLPAGRVLKAADLGLLASTGCAEVPVRRRLRVACFSTGDELQEPGLPLPPGHVFDSNRHALLGMLDRLGMQALDLGIVRDEPAALETMLRNAACDADAIISSGGVGVGDADHTRAVLDKLGEVSFWRVAMRPGRPLAVGRIADSHGGALLFALPGNPVASLVSFCVFVREALLVAAGATPEPVLTIRARAAGPIAKKPGRAEFQRAIMSRAVDGDCVVHLAGPQGSGIVRSMSLANGLVHLGHDRGDVAAGDWVDVMPFDGLM
jgi:molybdopterin molybdotransferase